MAFAEARVQEAFKDDELIANWVEQAVKEATDKLKQEFGQLLSEFPRAAKGWQKRGQFGAFLVDCHNWRLKVGRFLEEAKPTL